MDLALKQIFSLLFLFDFRALYDIDTILHSLNNNYLNRYELLLLGFHHRSGDLAEALLVAHLVDDIGTGVHAVFEGHE